MKTINLTYNKIVLLKMKDSGSEIDSSCGSKGSKGSKKGKHGKHHEKHGKHHGHKKHGKHGSDSDWWSQDENS